MKFGKMTKKKGIIGLIVAVLVIVFLGYTIIFGIGDRGKASYITQGLDLKGGVSITYEVSKDNKDWGETEFEDTRYKLEQRVQQFSTEARAYKEGEDRITVEIPGESDADEVIKELGKPGSLYFCSKADSTPTDEQIKNQEYVEVKDGNYKGFYQVWVTGDDVANAVGQVATDDQTQAAKNVVNLEFTSEGGSKFADLTSSYVGQLTYIIYDGNVISAPRVNEAITGGKAEITGQSTLEEAERLASNIRIGSLSLALDEISHKVDSAQLGSDALSKSLMAGLIGFIIIIIFLMIVYRIPGLAAGLALITYLELMLLALNGFDLTLTLPGIAGIILDIGMAVDANVIIYARIREEIAAGKSVKTAIAIGFEKARSAIVDGNITTLIAALVLLWRGSGTVKGFAQTLAIGILIQLFCALVVSRIFVWLLYHSGFTKPAFYGREKTTKIIDFVGKRKTFIGIAIAVIVIGFGAMIGHSATGGDAFYYSIEFKGGSAISVDFEQDYDMDYFNSDIKPAIEKLIGSSDVQGQKDVATGAFTIKTQRIEDEKFAKFKELLINDFGAVDSEDNFNDTMISSTVSKQMRSDAILATIVATLCMLVYIWIRFKDVNFAVAAVIALIHDVLITLGFYAISRVTVGTTFIAVMLTILGYSINATIVIFDRIRENKPLMKRGDTVKGMINKSIVQTLTRSIYTSWTTFLMVYVIFVMGVSSIREFTLPLMVGIVCGLFSSVCLTGSIWYILKGRKLERDYKPKKSAN